MKIKNWEVISDLTYIKRWNNFETSEPLVMSQEGIKGSYYWIVYNWKIGKHEFKTEKQAKSFAIAYMKKHQTRR